MDYSYIIIPLIVVLSSQAIKLLTDKISGNFSFNQMLISYGGMPSSHAAFSVSIATLVGLRLGLNSPVFGVALVFTILVLRDAISFRNIIGQQAKAINKLVANSSDNIKKDLLPLRERMGHSLTEVTAGALWGGALTYLLNLL